MLVSTCDPGLRGKGFRQETEASDRGFESGVKRRRLRNQSREDGIQERNGLDQSA